MVNTKDAESLREEYRKKREGDSVMVLSLPSLAPSLRRAVLDLARQSDPLEENMSVTLTLTRLSWTITAQKTLLSAGGYVRESGDFCNPSSPPKAVTLAELSATQLVDELEKRGIISKMTHERILDTIRLCNLASANQ
jgi:hypothetical protein